MTFFKSCQAQMMMHHNYLINQANSSCCWISFLFDKLNSNFNHTERICKITHWENFRINSPDTVWAVILYCTDVKFIILNTKRNILKWGFDIELIFGLPIVQKIVVRRLCMMFDNRKVIKREIKLSIQCIS